jgi:hypothetical protein
VGSIDCYKVKLAVKGFEQQDGIASSCCQFFMAYMTTGCFKCVFCMVT